MRPLSKRTRLILLAVLVFAAGLTAVVEFGGWHKLDAVTLDGKEINNPGRQLGLDPSKSVLKQPLEDAAALLLASGKTARVDIDIDLPGSLRIRTNRFTPICLVLDRASGRMLGLNYSGRAVPLPREFQDWENPVITGVNAGRIFEPCDDPRAGVIVPQLEQLADENRELYRLIDDIDLSAEHHATVTISGLPYRLKVSAEGFHRQITGFFRFVETYETEVDSARTVDLRFTDLIVQENRKR